MESSAKNGKQPVRSESATGKLVKRFTQVFVGLALAVTLHTLTAERPFSLLMPAEDGIDTKRLTGAVVGVVCDSTKSNEASTGSGILLSSDGVVLTNAHVIPQDQQYLYTPEEGCVVVVPDSATGSPSEMYWAKPEVIPGIGDDYDLAHLQIYAAYRDSDSRIYGEYPKTFSALYDNEGTYARICSGETVAQLGDPIRIFGYPAASGSYRLTVTEGIVSSHLEGGLIATSAKVDEGNSGGLAVDKRGCIVGVPSAVLKGTYENLGVIIPTQLIREFQTKRAKAVR